MIQFKIPYVLKGEHYFPVLRLIVKHQDKELKTSALIDSGASTSVFQASIAKHFGLDIKKGEKIFLQAISGKVTAYLHEIPLKFGSISLKCKIAFSEELTTSFNILGRDNFFRFFKITFDDANKELTFESNFK